MPSVLLGLGAATADGSTSGIYFYVPQPEFDTPNYESLSRDSIYNWISAPRLSRRPAMQFTGIGEESVQVEGRLYPHHFGGLSTIAMLRQAAEAGKPYDLVRFYPLEGPNGYGGVPIGRYVIRSVRTLDKHIGADGLPHRLDFIMGLLAYGDDSDLAT